MEFRLLGPVEVSTGRGPLRLGGRKQRGLLALLVLRANSVVSRDQLIDGVWGETPPPTIASALHVYLSKLRRLFESNCDGARLVTSPGGYRLDVDPERIDVNRFERLAGEGGRLLADRRAKPAAERLREALALWHGPALADLGDVPFAAGEQARLGGVRLTALGDRIDADLLLGRHEAVVAELEDLVAEHPYRERPRGQLMLALYRSGRPAEALATSRELRHLLLHDLGIEPGRELRRLELSILRGDPGLELAGADGAGHRQRSASAAEMHERFVAWLEARGERGSAEWEDLLAHHLEEAFRHHEAAGQSDRAEQVGQRAALLLARSGRRALERADVRAATKLLARARALSSPGSGRARRLGPALGESLLQTGDIAGAYAVLAETADLAAAPDDRPLRTLALVLTSYARAHIDPTERTELARTAENAVELFATLGDDAALARTLAVLADTAQLAPADAVRAAERAGHHAARAGDARLEAEAAVMACKYTMLGTRTVLECIAKVDATLVWARERGDRMLEARLLARFAWLQAMRGRPTESRRLLASARATMAELGHDLAAANTAVLASHIELLAENPIGAERAARSAVDELSAMGDVGSVGTLTGLLARALVAQGRDVEAVPLAEAAAAVAYSGDVIEEVEWRIASAVALGRLGRGDEALALTSDAVEAASTTELVGLHADAQLARAGALHSAGRTDEAASAADEATWLFEQKGDVVSARRAAELARR